MLTGDTILGRGSTVVAHPDGVLADYLASLHRLSELTGVGVLPGHGPELPDAGAAAPGLPGAPAAAAGAGPGGAGRSARASAQDVVERVYADVDRALWPAAELSVLAQLAYLRRSEQPSRRGHAVDRLQLPRAPGV